LNDTVENPIASAEWTEIIFLAQAGQVGKTTNETSCEGGSSIKSDIY
jgi:hypothetical protein